MTYDELLELNPYQICQKEKEAIYCGLYETLVAHHKNHCKPYANLLELLGGGDSMKNIQEIPMVPIGLFKEMELKSIPDDKVFKVITSSGTTTQKVSKIFLDETVAYLQQKTLFRIMSSFLGEKRIPMLILDTDEVLKNRAMFSARGAGILGFSILSSKRKYAFDANMQLDVEGIKEFLEANGNQPILVFGFTYMIWQYFYKELKKRKMQLPIENGILLHGGGWKKLEREAVSNEMFKQGIKEVSQIQRIYNYYGMAEQTGCVYMECEEGHLHASTYSDIIFRDMQDFSVCEVGKEGVVQVLSPMATSYPGHSILTEDQGILLGIDDCPCGRKGKYFRLTHRMKKAEVRGCSDTYER